MFGKQSKKAVRGAHAAPGPGDARPQTPMPSRVQPAPSPAPRTVERAAAQNLAADRPGLKSEALPRIAQKRSVNVPSVEGRHPDARMIPEVAPSASHPAKQARPAASPAPRAASKPAGDLSSFSPYETERAAYARDAYGSAGRAAAGNRGSSRVWRAVFAISIVVLVVALAVLGAIVYQYWAQQNSYGELEKYAQVDEGQNLALSDLTVDWDALSAINPDIVGWVYVPDTPINYPIVQGSDNETYLHRAFDGATGWLASAGTIFLDAGNAPAFSDRNSALYGHHMNDGSMFAAIADWNTDEAFNAHRDVYVLTPAGNYRLKTFALVNTVGSDAIVQMNFTDSASYRAYIQDKLDRSVVAQQGEVLSAADVKQSMLLSTCEYSQNDGRSVLFAAVVETTVAGDSYLASTDKGSTGLSSSQDAVMDRDFKEAA